MKLLIGLLLLLLITGCTEQPASDSTDWKLGEQLSQTPPEGYQRADKIRSFHFPADHGAHADYATEWWYLTGNLETNEGQRFGYQFTLFRIGIARNNASNESRWRSPDIYMGHIALTDIDAEQHYSEERFSRPGPGLAGVKTNPFKAWIGPWQLHGSDDFAPMTLNAISDQFKLSLNIATGNKPIILQGDQGLSKKSAAQGNASYYYSLTRLPTKGSITINGAQYQVSGNSWLDREWSSSALDEDQAGWDWFSLQLENQTELMFYQLRNRNNQAHPFSRGSLIAADGSKIDLLASQVKLVPTRWWESEFGNRYPVAWQLRIPEQQINLAIEAAVDDQLMRTRIRYWEGSVEVTGTHRGVGYMELSGYTETSNETQQ